MDENPSPSLSNPMSDIKNEVGIDRSFAEDGKKIDHSFPCALLQKLNLGNRFAETTYNPF